MARLLLESPVREIADSVFWLGGCGPRTGSDGTAMHSATSAFLIVGEDQTLLYDIGPHGHWAAMNAALHKVLAGRKLDWVVPSHPEVPHSGCLGQLMTAFPEAIALGDVRDYHLYYPEHEQRLRTYPLGAPIGLGGGFEFTLVEPIIKDLPNTVWGYERKNEVLFVADAFQYMHHADEDEALHRPGDCRLLASELPELPSVEHAQVITRGALAWTGLTDANVYVDQVLALNDRYPYRLVCPTHGNVIDDLDAVLPIMRLAYRGSQQTTG